MIGFLGSLPKGDRPASRPAVAGRKPASSVAVPPVPPTGENETPIRWHGLGRATLAVLLTMAGRLEAAPVTLAGITFSDELGGVVLHGGWGRGTLADPFVLVEDITDDGPAVLVVRGLRTRLDSPAGVAGQLGFMVEKIVTNRTSRPWHAFELELRERLDQASTYEDGLSFNQAAHAARAFTADRFTTVETTDEPLDAVVFADGLVPPGGTVEVSAMVTDYTPLDTFYLLQRRESPIAARATGRADG
jgi:hypothetical protein